MLPLAGATPNTLYFHFGRTVVRIGTTPLHSQWNGNPSGSDGDTTKGETGTQKIHRVPRSQGYGHLTTGVRSAIYFG